MGVGVTSPTISNRLFCSITLFTSTHLLISKFDLPGDALPNSTYNELKVPVWLERFSTVPHNNVVKSREILVVFRQMTIFFHDVLQ